LPFSTWSLAKLADFLVAEGVVDDISHEGLRVLLREEGVSFQAIKTWKQSNDPDFEAKKNRVLELYDLADGKAQPGDGDPAVVICVDEFGPLNLQPHPGKQWAAAGGQGGRPPRRRRRATYKRPHGVRHLLAAYDLGRDKLYGHVKPRKGRSEFLAFCRYLRSLYPPGVRIAIVLDNYSPTCRPSATPASATGRRPTTSNSPTCLRVLAQPHRSPIHGVALLRAGRHRPRLPRGAGPHDPPLHRLVQPQRRRPRTA